MKTADNRKKQLTPELLEECKKLKAIFMAKKKELKISQGSIADEMGVNQSSVSHYLNGVNALNASAASIFSKILKVDISDFSVRLANEVNNLICISNVSAVENHTLGMYKVYKYPVISWVSAGLCREALQPEYAEDYIVTDINAGEHGYWLKINGDSMTTNNGISFPNGIFILVKPYSDVRSGDYVISKLIENNEATFKQYIEEASIKYLKPLNTTYKMIELDERWKIIGKVVDARWRLS